ncbi:MAG: gliding motility protein, partial [Deltaproteobacteria bacterium]|nr:gliding motility protein [Deltaproteobacteria bacterium]
NLQENLEMYKKDIFTMPIVMQYNKIDLKDQAIPLTDTDNLNSDLNSQLKAPWFETSALKGINISAVLKKITSTTLLSLRKAMQ